MKKKWLNKLVILMILAIAIIAFPNETGAYDDVEVTIDGNWMWFDYDASPKIMNSNVLVPMRAIFEELDANVNWNHATQTITASTKNNDVIQLTIGNKNVFTNGQKTTITTPAQLLNGYTYVPLRFVAEALNKSVKWDSQTRTVIINSPTPTAEEVYEKMTALKAKYPEGMRWTNDDYYGWQGGIYSGGYGCVAFAYILSDEVFGKTKARIHEDFDAIKPGDILRINNSTHSVIVLKIEGTTYTVAEGNFNASIHWGREFTLDRIKEVGDFVMTRYME